jgi:hypothetical protein
VWVNVSRSETENEGASVVESETVSAIENVWVSVSESGNELVCALVFAIGLALQGASRFVCRSEHRLGCWMKKGSVKMSANDWQW